MRPSIAEVESGMAAARGLLRGRREPEDLLHAVVGAQLNRDGDDQPRLQRAGASVGQESGGGDPPGKASAGYPVGAASVSARTDTTTTAVAP